MTPAASHPAVPPPTTTTDWIGWSMASMLARKQRGRDSSSRPLRFRPADYPSHPEVEPQRVPPSEVDHIEHLLLEAPVRAERLVREVQGLEVHIEVREESVARAEVDGRARVDERRLRAEAAA